MTPTEQQLEGLVLKLQREAALCTPDSPRSNRDYERGRLVGLELAKEIAAAALAAYKDAPPVDHWQDISTAPKDGTEIAVHAYPYGWVNAFWSSELVEGWDGGKYVKGWTCNVSGKRLEPTHWQPLPPPPVSPKDSEGEQQ